ncbi:protein indeterminate-domain 7-like [Hibiscus syriacus]|uniref:protein indeterminate-domain 7-like n=1 Tax=Hibiscus syriacus TaxID=106335 RepID=UPI001920A814|nr:protein indeterminate-domain 7-like [Hibiscus syriacus]
MDHGLQSWLVRFSSSLSATLYDHILYQLPVCIDQCQVQLNKSNFMQDFEEDGHHGTVISQSSTESPNPLEHPITTDLDAEVVALSPRTLMATNRYICEVCHKGFQREQNLQLHRRGHNLPRKLKQRTNTEVKGRVYVCPEPNCVHHHPSRGLGDLTGIKKHFCRKHGEKKWKCEKCSKKYAVQSDWKAHAKICGTREYRCDCGTIFSRKDSSVAHRAFCNALTKTMASYGSCSYANANTNLSISYENMGHSQSSQGILSLNSARIMNMSSNLNQNFSPGTFLASALAIWSAHTSATALLQKAAEMGAKISDTTIPPILLRGLTRYCTSNTTSTVSLQSENGNYANLSGEVYVEGGEKTTVDFLGVEPTGHQNVDSERSHDGNIMNLGYSNEQQQSLNNLGAN